MGAALDQRLYDLFTTALEGGINGWASCSAYRRLVRGTDVDDLQGFYAMIHDEEYEIAEGEQPPPPYRLDREAMKRGWDLALEQRRKYNWSTRVPPVDEEYIEDWDYDAGDADIIVQLALLGEVVYG